MTRCPHCPKNATGTTCFTFVTLDHGYVDEPAVFERNGIPHCHNPNPVIGTWRCKNGHEFQSSTLRPCSGCSLERHNEEEKRHNDTETQNADQNCKGLVCIDDCIDFLKTQTIDSISWLKSQFSDVCSNDDVYINEMLELMAVKCEFNDLESLSWSDIIDLDKEMSDDRRILNIMILNLLVGARHRFQQRNV
jgi:hypothetical protein